MNPHQIIRDLHETDNKLGLCQAARKLRKIHVYPSNFQKMNVKLAFQVELTLLAEDCKFFGNYITLLLSDSFKIGCKRLGLLPPSRKGR